MRRGLYNHNLPTVRHNLGDFNDRANQLYTESRDFRFANFVLTGEFENRRGQRSQAFIDPILNIINDRSEPLTLQRDYDSLLGIAPEILVESDIQVFTIPHPRFSLKTSLHIKYPVTLNHEDHQVDFHKIPNFEFGSFGHRGHLHIFFPGLWTPERAKTKTPYSMSVRERTLWYECVFRPAIVNVLGKAYASEWPATLEAEEIRARKVKGGYSYGTNIITKDAVRDLAQEFHVQASATSDEWLDEFFFLHTIRGVKQSTFHPAEEDEPELKLEEFVYNYKLSPDIFHVGQWHIDVGIEISSDIGSCLQWLTATHHEVVRQALRISPNNAARITSLGSSKYSRDSASHLTAVSGFRIVPGARAAGPFEASYIQAYTTDKSVLYNPELGHHGKFLTLKEAMGSTQPLPTINGIHTIYESAKENNPSKARLEVRVPLEFATSVLVEFDTDALRRSLCSFSREDWWNFRINRLFGISQVLHDQANGTPEFRIAPDALSLTAACVWLLNGLHARPEDGLASRRLMDVALPVGEVDAHYDDPDDPAVPARPYRRTDLPHIRRGDFNNGEEEDEDEPLVDSEEEEEEEEEEGNAVVIHRGTPIVENGCVFFRPIHFGEVPRFRIGGPTLAPAYFRFFFRMSPEELEYRIVKPAVVDRELLRGRRMMTNKRRLPRYVVEDEQEPPRLLNCLGAAGDAMVLPPPVDVGSDNESFSAEVDDDSENQLTVNEHISIVYKQFLMDVLGKSPNLQGATNPSYLKLNDARRAIANPDVFQTLRLSSIFNAVAYKNGTQKEWRTSFDWLFPRRGVKTTTKTQGYPSSIYYLKWTRWANDERVAVDIVNRAREALWDLIRSFEWIPHAQQDKLWPTSARDGFIRWPDVPNAKNPKKSAPAARILLKQKAVPLFSRGEDDEEALEGGSVNDAQDVGNEERR